MPDGSVPAISAMATNVLYRLKFLTEFKPLKAHAFAFISNLIFSILSVGGVGVPADDKESSSEQMTLAIEVLAAHCHAGKLR